MLCGHGRGCGFDMLSRRVTPPAWLYGRDLSRPCTPVHSRQGQGGMHSCFAGGGGCGNATALQPRLRHCTDAIYRVSVRQKHSVFLAFASVGANNHSPLRTSTNEARVSDTQCLEAVRPSPSQHHKRRCIAAPALSLLWGCKPWPTSRAVCLPERRPDELWAHGRASSSRR